MHTLAFTSFGGTTVEAAVEVERAGENDTILLPAAAACKRTLMPSKPDERAGDGGAEEHGEDVVDSALKI